MELQREIRAFYIKLPNGYPAVTQDMIDGLWGLSKDVPVIALDITSEAEVVIHASFEFNLDNWNNAVRYLRTLLSLLNVKSGYLAVRKVIAAPDSLKTEVESYKITRRGIYNASLPEIPDVIEDVIRLSGANKKLQQIDAMEKLFRFIKENESDDSEGRSR